MFRPAKPSTSAVVMSNGSIALRRPPMGLCSQSQIVFSRIFRPRPNEHCDAADEEKPMITPDPYRAAANSDCHEQQWPDATCRCKKRRQDSGLFCFHAETLDPLAR